MSYRASRAGNRSNGVRPESIKLATKRSQKRMQQATGATANDAISVVTPEEMKAFREAAFSEVVVGEGNLRERPPSQRKSRLPPGVCPATKKAILKNVKVVPPRANSKENDGAARKHAAAKAADRPRPRPKRPGLDTRRATSPPVMRARRRRRRRRRSRTSSKKPRHHRRAPSSSSTSSTSSSRAAAQAAGVSSRPGGKGHRPGAAAGFEPPPSPAAAPGLRVVELVGVVGGVVAAARGRAESGSALVE